MTLDDIRAARERLGDAVVCTPLAKSETLSAQLGADIHLKFENQQFTASFKERGALNRLLLLPDATRGRGVVAMSAGNHAQALAYHGRRLGVPVTIVMPRSTPNAKVRQTRVFEADVLLHGNTLAETIEFTRGLAADRNLVLIHPFDDEAVIAGQGTLGLEMLEQAPDLDTLVVPVGGGGLIAGTALAAKAFASDDHRRRRAGGTFRCCCGAVPRHRAGTRAAGYRGRGDRRGDARAAHHADHPQHG